MLSRETNTGYVINYGFDTYRVTTAIVKPSYCEQQIVFRFMISDFQYRVNTISTVRNSLFPILFVLRSSASSRRAAPRISVLQ